MFAFPKVQIELYYLYSLFSEILDAFSTLELNQVSKFSKIL